ncbi:hypothetical protein BH11BAC3_BH11BAC3_13620 [soil metagenome]
MYKFVLIAFTLFISEAKAQTAFPGIYPGYMQRGSFANNLISGDSVSAKKWSFNKFAGLSTSFTFFKGGSATVFAAPIGLQVNRRLTNNLYAFANVAVAPAYVNFNRQFLNTNLNKFGQNNSVNSNGLNIYSSASLGLMYINDAKTFSISGSISVEKSSYPSTPFYPATITRPASIAPPTYR